MTASDGAVLKLERASYHLATLNDEVARYLARNPYVAVPDLQTKPDEFFFRVQIKEATPDRWGPMIGDFLSNLRSCLDHLAYRLATPAGGGTPPDGTEFPIFKDEPLYLRKDKKTSGWARGSGAYKVRGIPKSQRALIKDLQPYQRPNPTRDALWVLHDLNNIDKHRLLHVVGSIFNQAEYSLVDKDTRQVRPVDINYFHDDFRFGPFKDGAPIGGWVLSSPDPKVDVEAKFHFAVAFEEAGPASAQPLIPTLTVLRQSVADVVATLG